MIHNLVVVLMSDSRVILVHPQRNKFCDTPMENYKLYGQNLTCFRLGVGTFNLLMSLLPARITKLMEFVGFSATKVLSICLYKKRNK